MICLQLSSAGNRQRWQAHCTTFWGYMSNVEIWLRRAQAAVLLSPHRSETDFLKKTEQELKTEVDLDRLQFLKNSVRVEIMDPESLNLDFVDLPGEFFYM